MKQIMIFFLSIIMGALIFSCKESGTNPPEEKPPGYQEDIPWPSLADSPWPMGHHDPQSTGRSKFKGPALGTVTRLLDSFYITTGVSINNSNSIYFMSRYNKTGLFCYNKIGLLNWQRDTLNNEFLVGYSTPTLSSDGKIYFSSQYHLVAADTSGKMLWTFDVDDYALINYSSLSLDKEGNIYFVAKNYTLYSISKNGQLNWKLQNTLFNSGSWINGISFSPDGKTIYVPGTNPTLFAIDIETKEIKWTFGETLLVGSALIDSKGLIYVQSKVSGINNNSASLFCLNPNGTIRWSYPHNNPAFNNPTEPFIEGTIDKNGNYYFAFDTLYSVDYNGKLRWKTALVSKSVVPLISDNAGNIYLICEVSPVGKVVYSVNSSGVINWSTILEPSSTGFIGSPSINSMGELLISYYRGSEILLIK